MTSTSKVLLIIGFAGTLVYLLASSGILQRVSYDIYECRHRSEGKVKLWFNVKSVGQTFEFTRNNASSTAQIKEIQDGRITFSVGKSAFILDTITLRLIKEETGAVVIYKCDLNEFRM